MDIKVYFLEQVNCCKVLMYAIPTQRNQYNILNNFSTKESLFTQK